MHRQEHQLGAGPGMSFPCRSPWSFARILPNGDVQLCYRFTVGNLHRDPFDAIWYGEAAQAVRDRVVRDLPLCRSCDYYRFCLSSEAIDYEDVENYFAAQLLPGLDTVDFVHGTMALDRPDPPVLIETVGSVNIVRYRGRYICAPHALGPIDLQEVEPGTVPGLLVTGSLHEARRLARAAPAEGDPAPDRADPQTVDR
jgi:radical SAM protein with 4Fe4S-binding SPASM domain